MLQASSNIAISLKNCGFGLIFKRSYSLISIVNTNIKYIMFYLFAITISLCCILGKSYIVVQPNSPKPVFVAGDLSGVGLNLVKCLTKKGIPVRTLVKAGAKSPVEGLPLVSTIAGESNDEEAVQNCMNGCVAAVALVSGKTDGDGTAKLDYSGNSNIVEQAGILGVERIVFLSSIGCGDTKASVTEEYLNKETEFLNARNRAEKDVRMYTNLEWTIVRAGDVVKGDQSTQKAILTSDISASGSITAQDLSVLLVKTLTTPGGIFTRKAVTAVDTSLPSSIRVGTAQNFESLADSIDQ